MSDTRQWLIAYDIADPRRLRRVHALVARLARQLQYSLYLLDGGEARLDALLEAIRARIDPRRDDVRAYPLSPGIWWRQYGQSSLPDGVHLDAPGIGDRPP